MVDAIFVVFQSLTESIKQIIVLLELDDAYIACDMSTNILETCTYDYT